MPLVPLWVAVAPPGSGTVALRSAAVEGRPLIAMTLR